MAVKAAEILGELYSPSSLSILQGSAWHNLEVLYSIMFTYELLHIPLSHLAVAFLEAIVVQGQRPTQLLL